MTEKESETNVYSYNAQSLSACQNTESVLGLIRLSQWRQQLGPNPVPTARSPFGYISTAVVASCSVPIGVW